MNMAGQKEQRNYADRLLSFLKDYYGTTPVLTGFVVSGAAGRAAFTIATAYNSGSSAMNFFTNSNDALSAIYKIPENIAKVYSESRVFSSNWAVGGFAVGQFLGYKFDKGVKSLFKRFRR